MNYPKELLNALDQSISNVIERDMDRPSEYVADSILKWLNIPKPREFWIIKNGNDISSCYLEKPTYAVDSTGKNIEIIHVREVIE